MSNEATTYMTEALGPLPFCPGCGHALLVKALDKALSRLNLDPTKVVIVTDIGCIGLSDRYFTTNGFHGLHGRSITYACGIKLANPDLTVITLMGDGACGIGGTHLLNVARRNIGIKLIVANNFNYGMTGGQHSVTTFTDGITSTTPWGNVERPMDLSATVAAAGAAWVRRTTIFEKELVDQMVEFIQQDGFAMMDIWELCTAYYSPRNKVKKNTLYELLDEYGFKLGVVVDKPRAEYSASYRKAFATRTAAARRVRTIEMGEFSNQVPRQTGLIIAGSAGQKIKSTATLFARAAMSAGLNATQKDDYPITVMTGHSVAELIVSPKRIDFTGIEAPDYFLVLSEDGLKRTAPQIKKLPATCVLYADQSLELPETKARVRRLPFLDTAKEVSKLSLGVVALGAVLAETRMFAPEVLEAAIRGNQSPAIAEVNIRALAAGAALVNNA